MNLQRIWPLMVVLLLSAPSAWSVCALSRPISTFQGQGFSYIYTPGLCDGGYPCSPGGSVTDDLTGTFWAIGSGDPQVGQGNDNGSWPALQGSPGNFGLGWVYNESAYGYPAFILTNWNADPRIDGCVDDSPEICTAILLNDVLEGQGYFAYLTAAFNVDSFGYGQPGSLPISLGPLPSAELLGVVPTGNELLAQVGLPPLDEGIYTSANCSAQAPVGFRLFGRAVARGAPAPPSVDTANGWTVVPGGASADGGPIPLGQVASLQVECSVEPADFYVVPQLVFDSGYTSLLGPTGTPIPIDGSAACTAEPGDADGDGVSDLEDCDFLDPDIYPGAPQICDGKNNDCDDPNYPALTGTNEVDGDFDGLSGCAGDCDNSNPQIRPGASQICDGFNNDCNAPNWPALEGTNEFDGDGDSFTPCSGDCDDTDPQVSPDAIEICNGIDDDCTAGIDQIQGIPNDQDGIPSACDNCLATYNPNQQDADQDEIGSACDNCEFLPNASQADSDMDGEGNICDEDDGLVFLFFTQPEIVDWQNESTVDAFNTYRGDLRLLLAGGDYSQPLASGPAADQVCDNIAPFLIDFYEPDPGEAVFYLTTPIVQGVEGGLGDAVGLFRPNANPCD